MTKANRNLYRKEKRTAVLFIVIPLIGFSVFTLVSLVAVLVFSFADFNTYRNTFDFSQPFKNYLNLFTNETYSTHFFRAVGNTVLLLIGIPIGMVAGIALAALLQAKAVKKGKKIFQVLFYLPAVTSAVAVNLVFRYIFNPSYGIINRLLDADIHWFSDEWLIKVAIILKNTWSSMGGTMILYIAGMLAIPQSYYESADVDGASATHKFFKITLPLLTPTTFYIIITSVIGGLQSYADAKLFGDGAAGSQTIVWFIWQYGINQGKQGLASAASLVLAVFIMILTIVQFRFSNRWVYED
ncbi:MAG: sugar ABC transporter permease [Clostridia bacterium]|nr:sugar ABC transporter permease [Clostridia bacterium]